jgi:hypothetical protein
MKILTTIIVVLALARGVGHAVADMYMEAHIAANEKASEEFVITDIMSQETIDQLEAITP